MRRSCPCSLLVASLWACAPHELEEQLPDITEAVEAAPAPPACEVELEEQPAPLFDGMASIRMPRGVEPFDQGPTFATAVMAGGFALCDDRVLKRMMALAFAYDPEKSLHLFVNDFIETLKAQGYTDGQATGTFVDEPGRLQLRRHYPAAGGSPAVDLYLAFVHEHDKVVVVVFEFPEGEIDALQPTVEASVQTLQIVPTQPTPDPPPKVAP